MGKLHLIELKKDQDVYEGIHDYLMDKDWRGAVIVAGIGSIYDVEVCNPISYDMPPEKVELKVEKPSEILSFMGEIFNKESAPKDTPSQSLDTPSDYVVHIHMAFSHDNGIVNGGGFIKAKVLRAVNIYVMEIE